MKKNKKYGTGFDGLWELIRELRTDFTVRDLMSHIPIHKNTVRQYLKTLVDAGFLAEGLPIALPNDNYAKTYTLIKDNGIVRPVVGKHMFKPSKMVKKSQKIWLAVKASKTFQARDISFMTGVGLTYVKSYLFVLKKARYLKVIKQENHPAPDLYLFVYNTGAIAPQIKKDKSVYDANLKKIMWSPKTKKEEGDQS